MNGFTWFITCYVIQNTKFDVFRKFAEKKPPKNVSYITPGPPAGGRHISHSRHLAEPAGPGPGLVARFCKRVLASRDYCCPFLCANLAQIFAFAGPHFRHMQKGINRPGSPQGSNPKNRFWGFWEKKKREENGQRCSESSQRQCFHVEYPRYTWLSKVYHRACGSLARARFEWVMEKFWQLFGSANVCTWARDSDLGATRSVCVIKFMFLFSGENIDDVSCDIPCCKINLSEQALHRNFKWPVYIADCNKTATLIA